MANRHTVGVCGFGRCGSTMLMRMLIAGGCPAIDAAAEPPHEPPLEDLFRLPLDDMAGRCVKLLDSIGVHGAVPVARSWRFVWLDRDPVQQARSTIKMLQQVGGMSVPDSREVVGRFAASYGRDRPQRIKALQRHGSVFVLRFERVLADPWRAGRQLRQVWPGLDVQAAAAVVHARDGRCREDLSVEVRLSGG